MIIALLLAGMMLVACVVVLQAATATSANTTDLQQKSQIFDAAEAGVDAAINALDQSSITASGTCTTGSLKPYGASGTTFSYNSCVGNNNSAGGSAVTASDPSTGNSINVPAGMSFVYGSASSSLTGETTYAEAIVTGSSSLTLPAGAMDAAGNATFSGTVTINADNPPTNNDAAAIANGNFTESGTVTVQGPMESHGTNTHAGTLTDTATLQNQSVYSFPTNSAISSFKTAALTAAQSGTTMTPAQFLSTCAVASACSGNIYVNGSITVAGATNLTLNGTGTVYINGNITTAGTFNVTNKNGASVVVNGNITGAGGLGYNVGAGVSKASLLVLGTSGMTLAGSGQNVGIVWTPYGNLTLAGSSGITGQVIAGNGDTCNYSNGCGNVTNAGNFLINYQSGLTIPNAPATVATIVSYFEH